MVAKPAGGTARRIFSPSPTQMDEASVCESVLTIIIRPARGGAGPPAAPSAHPLRRAPAPLPTVIKPVCLRVKPCVCAKTAGGNRGSARRRFLWACDATESAAIYSVNTFITHRGGPRLLQPYQYGGGGSSSRCCRSPPLTPAAASAPALGNVRGEAAQRSAAAARPIQSRAAAGPFGSGSGPTGSAGRHQRFAGPMDARASLSRLSLREEGEGWVGALGRRAARARKERGAFFGGGRASSRGRQCVRPIVHERLAQSQDECDTAE